MFRCKHSKLIYNLKCEQGDHPEIIATPQPKMPRIRSTLPNKYGAVSAGAASRSRAGSAALYNSWITFSSIQGVKTLIASQLVDLEEAQLTVKNIWTKLVGSGTMNEEAVAVIVDVDRPVHENLPGGV